jgi:hypothetical protein
MITAIQQLLTTGRLGSSLQMSADRTPIAEFLRGFEETVQSSAAQLLKLSDDQSQERRSNDSWTRKQILGHLIDSAANNHQRFVRAQFTNELAFPGYDGDQWVDVQRYNDADWSQLVQLWKLYNLHLIRLVSYIPNNVLELQRSKHNLDEIAFKTVDQKDPVTLDYFIRDYVDHLRHHLDQIFRTGVE